jgi:acyl carrier protein
MGNEVAEYVARREEILETVREILIENLDVQRAPDEIDPDTPLFGSGLGLDSVDAVELMVCVYSRFEVALTGDVVGRMALRTPNSLVDFVLAEQEARGDD